MTQMNVPATEFGVVRVFSVDIPQTEIERFVTPDATGSSPLEEALGASGLNRTYVEVFDLEDLEELGLARYLNEGLGVSVEEVAPYRVRLEATKGTVAVILSKAFGGQATTLTPKPPLRWLATFAEETPDRRIIDLKSESAKGQLAQGTGTSRSPYLTLILALLALPLAAAIMALVVWVLS